MTSEALSALVDVNATHIRHLEGGSAAPSLKLVLNLCNALEISADDLLMDSLGDYAKGIYRQLNEKISHLTPGQVEVVSATVDTMLKLNKAGS